MTRPHTLGVVLRAAGVALAVDVSDANLPAVVYWGADCGELDAAAFDALVRTGIAPIAPNDVDEPIRLSVLPEEWTGWSGRPGLNGSRAGRAWSPRLRARAVRLDAVVVEAGVHNAGAATLAVDAVDETTGLALTLTIEMTASGIVRTRARLTNLDDEPYQLDELLLTFPVPSFASEILDMAGRWGKERVPQRSVVGVGAHRREGRHGRTGADAATLLSVGEPGFGFGRGEVWSVHTGWSGNHVHQLERVSTGVQVISGGELLLPGEVRLGRDESYESPWIYGAYGDGLDAVARRFHALLRARPRHPSSPRPVTLNVWEAVYFDHDLDVLLALAQQAADLGVERFVLDDGWFGSRRDDFSGLGDWTVSADVWPDGLHPLVNRVRDLGMQFGLWFEPEMVNVDSDLARAHPEWIMAAGDELPVESRHQQVLNLGIPECYAHIRDAIFAVLDEYDIAYIKWDHNRDLVQAGTLPTGRPGVHEQTLAFYRLLEEIGERFPGLEIESCSSGGARVDLGVLEHTDRVWVSDNIDPLDRQQMNRWTTQLVPPEMMGSHIASGRSHTTGRWHDLSFRAVTALFGHLGIEWDLRLATDQERAELRSWIAFYKQHRTLLHGGHLVRLDHADDTIAVNGVVAPDGSAAVFSYASLARASVVSPGRVRLPGLLPDARYRVVPIVPDPLPSRFTPAPWWGFDPVRTRVRHTGPAWQKGADAGIEMSGALLATAGLMAPLLYPETAVVYSATRI